MMQPELLQPTDLLYHQTFYKLVRHPINECIAEPGE